MAESEREILVAVDEGEESSYALSWCINNVIQQNSKDTLILLYAIPPRVFFSSMDASGYVFSSDMVASMERYSHEVADTVLGKAKALCKYLHHVTVETLIEDGDPRDVICEVADMCNVDLLVMGSRGYGLFKRAFLGSVSSHCAQHVKCPVLIVKMP